MYKVAVIGDDALVVKMFEETGNAEVTVLGNPLEQAANAEKFNLVVFTGGSDVTPWLYGEPNLASHTNLNRDIREILWYHRFLDTPKVGICRGGQFLFVMNGGKMEQHIDGHGGNHTLQFQTWDPQVGGRSVTSTHHQHMRYNTPNQSVLATASHDGVNEVVWSGMTRSLSFQPHPEYEDPICRKLFFWYIDKLLKQNYLKKPAVLVDWLEPPNLEMMAAAQRVMAARGMPQVNEADEEEGN